MWKYLAPFALLLTLAGCVVYPYDDYYYRHHYHERYYRYSKATNFMKMHWDVTKDDNSAVVAEGYVEPFNPDNGLTAVRLELVGLDAQGNVVNKADGIPKDNYIESPYYPSSPFKIEMKLNGREKSFTMAGSYYHYGLGERQKIDTRHIDYIPVSSR
jgi:hypothetical protein